MAFVHTHKWAVLKRGIPSRALQLVGTVVTLITLLAGDAPKTRERRCVRHARVRESARTCARPP